MKARYEDIYARCAQTPNWFIHGADPRTTLGVPPEEREAFWETRYAESSCQHSTAEVWRLVVSLLSSGLDRSFPSALLLRPCRHEGRQSCCRALRCWAVRKSTPLAFSIPCYPRGVGPCCCSLSLWW